MRTVALAVVLVLVLAAAPAARADTWITKDGGRISGDLIGEEKSETGAWTVIRTGFGTVRLRKAEIRRTVAATGDTRVLRLTEIAVTAVEGKAERSRDDGASWTPLLLAPRAGDTAVSDALPTRLGPGERVRSGPDGRAEFDVGFGVVHLGPASDVTFQSARGATMKVHGGETGVRVDETVPGREFRVETPQTALGVHGTTFLVDVAPDATTVAVAEGRVSVASATVAAGGAVRVGADGAAVPVTPEFAEDRFERLRQGFTFPRLDWVLVPGGETTLGGPSAAVPKGTIERMPEPRARVRLPAFLMTRTEVTVASYRSFRSWAKRVGDAVVLAGAPPAFKRDVRDTAARSDPPLEDDEPAQVPWQCAKAFALAVGARLQSSAEWEHAIRCGLRTEYPWGAEDLATEYEWVAATSGDREVPWAEVRKAADGTDLVGDAYTAKVAELRMRPHPVGRRKPIPWGLHDMLANVAEWCEDADFPTWEGQPADGSPRADRSAGWHEFRGHDFAANFSFHSWRRFAGHDGHTKGMRLVRRLETGP